MDSITNFDYIFKVIIVGDSGVGKTCLLQRLVDGQFTSEFATTIGVDFKLYSLNVDSKVIKLQIWDTAGQERFRGITNSFYRGANGVLLCFDVTSPKSFEEIPTWMTQIRQFASAGVPLVLVGCKADAPEKGTANATSAPRLVCHEEAVVLAKRLGSAYIETSAKENTNVRKAFEYITRMLLHEAAQKLQPPNTNTSGGSSSSNSVVESGGRSPTKGTMLGRGGGGGNSLSNSSTGQGGWSRCCT